MPREKREVVLQREVNVWELRQKGWSQVRIAAHLELDQSTVSKILKRVSERALSELGDEVVNTKLTQVRVLEHIADEALQAWEASKQNNRIVTQKVVRPGEGAKGLDGQPPQPSPTEVTQRVEDKDGDPRYLETAMKALADVRKILGADAPVGTHMDLTLHRGSDVRDLTDEQLAQLATRQALTAPTPDHDIDA